MSNPFSDNTQPPPDPASGKAPRGRFLFVVFLMLVIALAFIGGYLIRVYFGASEPRADAAPGSPGPALGELAAQWREHRLPLDVKSLARMWEEMKADLERKKIPELKAKLEDLKAQIEERKQKAKPELEQEWKNLSDKVDGLIASIQNMRDDWADQFSAVQDEAKKILEKEAGQVTSETPAASDFALTPTP